MRMLTVRRPLAVCGIVLAVLVVADQVVQHTVLAHGYLGTRRVAPFDPPVFCDMQERSVERARVEAAHGVQPGHSIGFDPQLGWSPRPGASAGEFRFDWAGARYATRPVARERDPLQRRAVAIGCSFTMGVEVQAGEAWPALVDDARADLEVVNHGVGGYGLDQVYLRLVRDGLPLAPDEVWVGVFPHAVNRLVTTYAPALDHWAFPASFKPRFELGDEGELVRIDVPARSIDELLRLLSSQRDFLAAVEPHDRWVHTARAAYAPRGTSPWHVSALGRLWLTRSERAGRDVAAELADPSGEVFLLARALLLAMHASARGAGARLRVFVLPSAADLARARVAGGERYWSTLRAALCGASIDWFDASDALVAAGGHAESSLWAPQGHYTPAGHRIVADALLVHLREHP